MSTSQERQEAARVVETCAGCLRPAVHDIVAEWWLGGDQLYDPDRVDYDNPAGTCEDTGEPHYLGGEQ